MVLYLWHRAPQLCEDILHCRPVLSHAVLCQQRQCGIQEACIGTLDLVPTASIGTGLCGREATMHNSIWVGLCSSEPTMHGSLQPTWIWECVAVI